MLLAGNYSNCHSHEVNEERKLQLCVKLTGFLFLTKLRPLIVQD